MPRYPDAPLEVLGARLKKEHDYGRVEEAARQRPQLRLQLWVQSRPQRDAWAMAVLQADALPDAAAGSAVCNDDDDNDAMPRRARLRL